MKKGNKNNPVKALSVISLDSLFSFKDFSFKSWAESLDSKKVTSYISRRILVPVASMLAFLLLWHFGAGYLYQVEVDFKINKALEEQGAAAAEQVRACIESGDVACKPTTLPSPVDVWNAYNSLLADHETIQIDKAEFEAKNEARIEQGLSSITYTGRPSFVDQIITSLQTVFAGFLLAMLIAVPLGIVIGLSPTLRVAFTWFIQIFKPVSPVVWLLLVFMIIKTLTKGSDGDTSFLISFVSVGLCSMWATLVNTAMGVSNVPKDYLNVAKMLKLNVLQKVFKIVLPSSIPLIFTGLRLTLSVAWMVLIAIELLAQSPGLGSFVWEEFQNGATDSNSKIIVAMFVIGIIGFLLDRLMFFVQRFVSFDKKAVA